MSIEKNPNRARDRKEAAKILGIALAAKHRTLLMAIGEEEIGNAALDLGATFNGNIEFICWILKEYGGVVQMPFSPSSARPIVANDAPATPALFAVETAGDLKRKH